MDSTARTQITVAVIGVVGVLGAALITNWSSIFGSKPETKTNSGGANTVTIEYSLTCKFTYGPRSGSTFRFSPGPGISPAPVGSPCTDGLGSTGFAVKD